MVTGRKIAGATGEIVLAGDRGSRRGWNGRRGRLGRDGRPAAEARRPRDDDQDSGCYENAGGKAGELEGSGHEMEPPGHAPGRQLGLAVDPVSDLVDHPVGNLDRTVLEPAVQEAQ
jgi:hypothetical protein